VAESFRISRSGGRLMIVVDTTHNPVPGGDDALPIAADLTAIARACGWKYWNDFAWIKPEVGGSKTTFGSLASCSAPGFGRDHEWILLFFKDQKKLDGENALCDLTREEHKKWWHTTWNMRPETRRDILATHPAPFPEELAERATKLLTYRRDLVVDPYNGSGTTTAVAKRLGRRFIGVDRSGIYCKFSRQRLEPPKTLQSADSFSSTSSAISIVAGRDAA
jgi:DNA modification methylase